MAPRAWQELQLCSLCSCGVRATGFEPAKSNDNGVTARPNRPELARPHGCSLVAARLKRMTYIKLYISYVLKRDGDGNRTRDVSGVKTLSPLPAEQHRQTVRCFFTPIHALSRLTTLEALEYSPRSLRSPRGFRSLDTRLRI